MEDDSLCDKLINYFNIVKTKSLERFGKIIRDLLILKRKNQ